MKDELLHDRWKGLGFDRLLPEEQDYILVWWLTVEVLNGAFDQYFSNDTGDFVERTHAALIRCSADRAARVVNDAMGVFSPVGGYSVDRKTRNERIKQLKACSNDPFRKVSEEFENLCANAGEFAWRRVQEAYRREGISVPTDDR